MSECKCPDGGIAANCSIHATAPSDEKVEDDLKIYGVHYQRKYLDNAGRFRIERLDPTEIAVYRTNHLLGQDPVTTGKSLREPLKDYKLLYWGQIVDAVTDLVMDFGGCNDWRKRLKFRLGFTRG